MKKENLPQLLEITLQFLYNDQYIESLIVFLRGRQVQSVLDCACGTGFPSIQLKKAGFDKVSPLTLDGENGYDIFVAERLDSSITSPNSV